MLKIVNPNQRKEYGKTVSKIEPKSVRFYFRQDQQKQRLFRGWQAIESYSQADTRV